MNKDLDLTLNVHVRVILGSTSSEWTCRQLVGISVGSLWDRVVFFGKARVGKLPYWELASNCVNLIKSFSLFKSH